MARLVAAFGVGYAIGPLLGSWIATTTDSDKAPAFATAGLFIGLMLAVAVALPETRPVATTAAVGAGGDSGGAVAGWKVLINDPGLIRVVLVTTLPEFAFVMVRQCLSPFISDGCYVCRSFSFPNASDFAIQHTTTTLASLTVQTLGQSKEWLASVSTNMFSQFMEQFSESMRSWPRQPRLFIDTWHR